MEWGLEYDGGHPVVLFEVHVILYQPHSRRPTTPSPSQADIVYHADISAGQLVTRTMETGHTYIITATAANILGPSSEQISNGK